MRPQDYRPCVSMALFNRQGQLWLGKRFGHQGPFCWQCPQGGIDKGEAPEHAAIRELWEETGTRLEHVTPLGEISDWLYYDFPSEYRGTKKAGSWHGQRQKWYAFRYHGADDNFCLTTHGEQEFSKWRWGNLRDAPTLIVPFKRSVYDRVAIEFERFARPAK